MTKQLRPALSGKYADAMEQVCELYKTTPTEVIKALMEEKWGRHLENLPTLTNQAQNLVTEPSDAPKLDELFRLGA